MISDAELDAAILAVTRPTWRKVALVVSQATKRIGESVANDEGYHVAAARIEALVAEKRLVSRGDLARWRYSEVRLP